ncbi:MAG: CDP-alcohol phosphatidyltransferase family protein [Paracoccaceae bacterium]|nr:CDP-alcohol phosphatidyltransferase family protein [Paracoccaceae bacterium]
MSNRVKAFLVHYFTAIGAILAMLAMLAAVDERWDLMFLWLVAAFFVDGLDGPLARKFDVKKFAPEYDGVLLDLIIDYLTYVFIPAYALFVSGLLNGWSGWVCIILIAFTSVLYFADTRMKTKDNSFAGFPGCWNMAVLVLFSVRPSWQIILIIVVLLSVSMFTNLKFIHPVRTKRWRFISLPVATIWTFLGAYAAWYNFNMIIELKIIFILATAYLLLAGIVQQSFPKN